MSFDETASTSDQLLNVTSVATARSLLPITSQRSSLIPSIIHSGAATTNLPSPQIPLLPTAYIVLIGVGAYIVFVVIICILRNFLESRGICGQCYLLCGNQRRSCCECCYFSCKDSCSAPNYEAWMNSVCPARKHQSCIDLCSCESGDDRNSEYCDNYCGDDVCDCRCLTGESSDINCLCCTIQGGQTALLINDDSSLK